MKFWSFLILAVLGGMATADDGIWQEWEVNGNGCSDKTIDVLKNGDSLAVLFNELAVKLDPGEKPVQEKRHCNFKIKVEPPEGHNLVAFQQLYSGGVIKGAKSEVRIAIAYRLGNVKSEKSLVWGAGKAIRPEDPESMFTRTYSEINEKTKCREKTQYIIRVDIGVMRKNKDVGVIASLDSVDTQAEAGVRFIPQWKPCVNRR